MQSSKEKENKKLNEEILQLLSKPTTKVQFYTKSPLKHLASKTQIMTGQYY